MASKPGFAALICAVLVISTVNSPAQESRANDHLAAATSIEIEALSIIARRTNAYNDHDIEAFLATYDENVRIYEYPDKLLGEGTERMRRIFGPQFAEKDGLIVEVRLIEPAE